MANALLNINMITLEAIRLFINSNEFIQHIDRQYDDSFAVAGAKIGQSLRIRLPNDFTVATGPALSAQDTAEQSITLPLATQKHVDVSYSTVDRTMTLDTFSRRVLAPMVNNLAGAVAADVMTGVEAGVSNLTGNFDAAGNVLAPLAATWLLAGAVLDLRSAPRKNRKLILDPLTMARTVSSLAGLFNPSKRISDQYETGQMQEALGFDWFTDQTVIKHLTAAYTGTGSPATIAGTVNGAGQTGLQIVTNAIAGGLAVGDIITFAGSNGVNRVTKQTTGQLNQFVVTSAVAANGTLINIYPALIPGNPGYVGTSGLNGAQYQTVDASPANSANISVATLSGSTYRKNIAFAPEAITLATADLEMPKGVHEVAREEFDGISMRMLSDYIAATDQMVTRLDVLYGFVFIRPEWCVAVPDLI
jgi:P22 coat protein - gene protein 5